MWTWYIAFFKVFAIVLPISLPTLGKVDSDHYGSEKKWTVTNNTRNPTNIRI